MALRSQSLSFQGCLLTYGNENAALREQVSIPFFSGLLTDYPEFRIHPVGQVSIPFFSGLLTDRSCQFTSFLSTSCVLRSQRLPGSAEMSPGTHPARVY